MFYSSTPFVGPAMEKKVKVFVRIRPLAKDSVKLLTAQDKEILLEDGSQFSFDGVFKEDATQQDVFEEAVMPLLEKVKQGRSSSIIAYGHTGCGKTYTMGTEPSSNEESEGIVQRAVRTLLGPAPSDMDVADKENLKHQTLKISFLELYNESFFDLLADKRITFKPDGCGGIVPFGHTEQTISTPDEAIALFKKCNALRRVAITAMNPRSSRSHAILSLRLGEEGKRGYLQFVDLAGSEEVGRQRMEGQGFSEGVSINRDLLAMGKVLTARSNAATPHIPYRESTLTRLLKDVLEGPSHTVMIACICPSKENMALTLNTLRYVERAQKIKAKPLPHSTCKPLRAKRPHDDPTATPSFWKKGKKVLDHNATVSTPGHKPPTRAVPPLNNTFATPLPRGNYKSLRKGPMSSSRKDLSSCLQQPVFEEEEDSPSKFSVIEPPLETTSMTFSPLIEKMNNRWEQTMVEKLEECMESIENRLFNKVAGLMLHGKTERRCSERLKKQLKKEGESSPLLTDEEDTLRLSDDKEAFADTIANALIKKRNFAPRLQSSMQDVSHVAYSHNLTTSKSDITLIKRDSIKDLRSNSPSDSSIPPIVFTSPAEPQSRSPPRRRSTRKSALLCTFRNMQLLSAQTKRPACGEKKRRSSRKSRAPLPLPDQVVRRKHRGDILRILNSGSLRELQKLPSIGPKTAMIIHNYKKQYGSFKYIEDIKNVSGLAKSFYTRFCQTNLLE